MSEAMSVTDRDIDITKMTVSTTEVRRSRLSGMNKWFGRFPRAARHRPQASMKRRAYRHLPGRQAPASRRMIRCINRLEEHQQGQIIGQRHRTD